MNPRQEPHPRWRPTHTFWPAGRRPDPPALTKPVRVEEPKDDERAPEEPGYGHGV
jgi:hypothetical protein